MLSVIVEVNVARIARGCHHAGRNIHVRACGGGACRADRKQRDVGVSDLSTVPCIWSIPLVVGERVCVGVCNFVCHGNRLDNYMMKKKEQTWLHHTTDL